ncbi:MAG TPA: L-ribulose-5-phosphate 4-epimerase AraD [Acidimicrobiales bacterium]|nr:L-ribulose-5-phosphate 4-epimerase AraD [Acidimicrobiales bacterium]
MLEELKEAVLEANLGLPRAGLVRLTWGNVSGRDPATGLVVIKPSGMPYSSMSAQDMVVVDGDGKVVEGARRPSTDTPTHIVLYKGLPGIGGVVHTHSKWATAWAQAGKEIPLFGTTHADFCPGPVPLTRQLTPEEVSTAYERETGTVVLEAVAGRSPDEVPAVLVRGHGPFCWGTSAAKAVEEAEILEAVAEIAWLTVGLGPSARPLPEHLIERHFTRKHGPGAYYGQS